MSAIESSRPADSTALLAALDGMVSNRVLVFGRLPPEGHDVDLFVRPDEHDALARGMSADGFTWQSEKWVRFRSCSADVIEIATSPEWQLPPGELEAMFREGLPIAGLENLARMAPHHMLLALARYAVGARDRTRDLRAKVDRAIEEDPLAWERARERAPAWRATKALACLERAHRTKQPIPARAKVDAMAEWAIPLGVLWTLRARVVAWRTLIADTTRRHPTGAVIAFSGIDGAGKSSQVHSLEHALIALGFDVRTEYVRFEWSILHESKVLGALTWPVRAAIRLRGRSRPAPAYGPEARPSSDPGAQMTRLRERSPLLTRAWVTVVALTHGVTERRLARRHVRSGRIVIFDRYTLDAVAAIRARYGRPGSFRPQMHLMRTISLKPLRAYFLDIRPETSLARDVDDFPLEDLAARAGLYRAECDEMGVKKLDGERPREDLCAEIARDAWEALRSR